MAVLDHDIEARSRADAAAGRTGYEREDYVAVEDVLALLAEQGNRCWCCGKFLQLAWRDAHVQFSIDRLDNESAHVKGNVRIACLGCNVARKRAAS